MSQLKQVVKSALEIKSVGPQILSNIDVLLQRSIQRLQNQDILSPRTLEFTSKDRKQEKRNGDDLIYHYYYLPKDFRKLDEFRPYKTYPYHWTGNEHELYREIGENYTESDLKKIQRKFTIVNNNHDQDSKYEKILIAFPFPDDDETIQLKYYVNGKGLDYDWIDASAHEAIISDIETMVGLRKSGDPEVEQRISDAVEQSKEMKGHNQDNKTAGTLGNSRNGFFGKRSENLFRSRNKNNL